MTTHYKTQAFVFKRSDINEADRVFSVFTNDFGRLDIFAKSIRKNISKLRGGMDIFYMSQIEFIQGKNRKTLTDATAIEKFGNVTSDPKRFKIAGDVADIMDNFIIGQEKDAEIFSLLDDVFHKLNDHGLGDEKCVPAYYYFLWNILRALGYLPEVHKCNACGAKLNPYAIYFSNKLGGVICKKCLGQDVLSYRLNSDVVKTMRLIFKKEWQVISKLKMAFSSQKLFKEVSDNYYSYILSGNSFKNN